MNMAQYSEAIALLPEGHKAKRYDDIHEVWFKGKLIIAHRDEKPMVFENGEWKEFAIEYYNDKGAIA